MVQVRKRILEDSIVAEAGRDGDIALSTHPFQRAVINEMASTATPMADISGTWFALWSERRGSVVGLTEITATKTWKRVSSSAS